MSGANRRRGAPLLVLLLLPACGPALRGGGGTCSEARTEADFAAVSRRLARQLDGELRLHALSPSAMEALTRAPVPVDPPAILWTFRFTATDKTARPGRAPRLSDADDRPSPHLTVVTRERIYASAPVRRGAGREDTRAIGIRQLMPIPSDEDGAERVEIRMFAQERWLSSLDARNGGPPACSAALRVTLPLPPGGALWDRLNRAFLSGPLPLRGGALGARSAALPAAAAPTGAGVAEVACAAGESEGCYHAAQMLLSPARRPSSPEQMAQAQALLHRACDLGHGPACGAYGLLLHDRVSYAAGEGATRRQALDAFRRACDLDFGDGCAELAVDAVGRGEEALARTLFALGCDLGSEAACDHKAAPRRDAAALQRRADELLEADRPATGGKPGR